MCYEEGFLGGHGIDRDATFSGNCDGESILIRLKEVLDWASKDRECRDAVWREVRSRSGVCTDTQIDIYTGRLYERQSRQGQVESGRES